MGGGRGRIANCQQRPMRVLDAEPNTPATLTTTLRDHVDPSGLARPSLFKRFKPSRLEVLTRPWAVYAPQARTGSVSSTLSKSCTCTTRRLCIPNCTVAALWPINSRRQASPQTAAGDYARKPALPSRQLRTADAGRARGHKGRPFRIQGETSRNDKPALARW
jgi:hypothetical protein